MAEFEDAHLRKTYRLKIPAKVSIDGKEYKVLDWSYEGFRIEKSKEDVFEKDKVYKVKFILPFASFNVAINAEAINKWSSEDQAGFEFKELPDEAKEILKKYVQAYIEGRLEEFGEFLSTAERLMVPPPIEEPLTEEEERRLNRKLFIAILVYLLIALALAFGLYLVFWATPKAYSVDAFYSGNVVSLITPWEAILEKVYVKEGDEVRKNQVLFKTSRIEDEKDGYGGVGVRILRDRAAILREIEKTKNKIALLDERIKATRFRLRSLKVELEKAKSAFELGYISRSVYEDKENEYKELLLSLRELEKEKSADERYLAFLYTLLKELGSFYAGGGGGDEEDNFEIYRAPFDGIVLSVYYLEGQILTPGMPVMVIESLEKKGYVIARFKKRDVLYINVGDKARVYFPSIEKTVEGKVIAIGKKALGDESMISESEEYALPDVPVKIELFEYPQELHHGIKAEVEITPKHYEPYIIRYIKRFF
ncbi:HlyD family secretion protein [Aquifex aeolicus]|uniref:PilZ domain-containing protein n=1 Tax=Aquifex aeolicus (strain VF5) TaxID=224324 RepID=O67595_AQUAE|nr:HlyD family efflux transporter periplasmic adaptor subunit [Aquifex aeolicus]AAC07560.1 putative protein [Aquifex aeolicus VF5]